jgi:hypothetical protein
MWVLVQCFSPCEELQPGSMVSSKMVWLINPGTDLRIGVRSVCNKQRIESTGEEGRGCQALHDVLLSSSWCG